MISLIIGALVFGTLVLVHEYGHFIAARKNGILVLEFAIGMGPKIFSFKPGETVYSLRLLPLGGFCKMLGELDDLENTTAARSFQSAPIFGRMIVIVAGAFMNFVLALVLFLVYYSSTDIGTTTFSEVIPGSASYEAGFLPGDKIISINGDKMRTFSEISMKIGVNKNKSALVKFKRGENIEEVTLTPKLDTANVNSDRYLIGLRPVIKAGVFSKNANNLDRAGLLESSYTSFWELNLWMKMTLTGIGQLVTGQAKVKDLSGPIQMTSMLGSVYDSKTKVNEDGIPDTFSDKMLRVIYIAAILSASIGMFNLLPLPALDGGRLIFLIVEAIRKKPISEEKEGYFHFIGFVMLMILAAFVAFNDIQKFFVK